MAHLGIMQITVATQQLADVEGQKQRTWGQLTELKASLASGGDKLIETVGGLVWGFALQCKGVILGIVICICLYGAEYDCLPVSLASKLVFGMKAFGSFQLMIVLIVLNKSNGWQKMSINWWKKMWYTFV